MENRFTVKDLFLFVVMITVIVVVVVAMFQYDRQWDTLKSIERQVGNQTGELAESRKELATIRQLLQRGVNINTGSPATTAPAIGAAAPTTGPADLDPFSRLRIAMTAPDFATGDWLVYNMGVKLSKLTPLLNTDVYGTIVQARVMETLAMRDPDTLKLVPLLAESWKESEDGLTIDVKLRHGVVFSNGDPFTADDVVWTFEWIMNPAVDAPRWRVAYERVKSVEKVNDYEVVFHFKEPFFEALETALGMQPMSKKFYSRFDTRQFNESVGLLIGTGPYRMRDPEAWKPGAPVELVRNERYWGVPNPFNRLYWYEVEEDAASLTMFRNGETDIFSASPEQYVSLIKDEQLMAKAQRYEYYPRDGGYTYVAWNQKRVGQTTRFADKRVRQAMTLLIDRERMARDLWRGYAKPAPGPFGVISPQNAPDVQPWPYDPKRAMELLAEAGYHQRNANGVLTSDSGDEFRFKLMYNNKNVIGEQIALQIKDGLARVGIVVEQDPTDWPVMLKKLDTRDFDAITLGWTGGIETDIYQMFHSSQIADNADNFMSYSNPELDKLIEKARSTIDIEKRMPIWQECHRILNEDQPYTFLLYREALVLMDKRIQNVRRSKSGLNYLSDDIMPIPWYVPAAMQKHTD
jgi:peptide/nickel transport system substrate-binding protein